MKYASIPLWLATGPLTLGCGPCDPDADEIRKQIEQALDRHVAAEVLLERSAPCGPDGIESGGGAINPSLPEADRQTLIDDYATACARLRKCS